jgi:hypothetical protein
VLVLHLLAAVTVYPLAQWLQGPKYDAHIFHGGNQGPAGTALLVGLFCGLVLLMGGLALDAFFFARGRPGTVVFGRAERVTFRGGATREQAQRLGRLLKQERLFDGTGPRDVDLAWDGSGFVVSFLIETNMWDNPDVVFTYRQLHNKLEQEVFRGQPVEIRLCDPFQKPQRFIRAIPGHRIDLGDKGDLYYTGIASEELARRLERFLQEENYFDGRRPRIVRLSGNGDRFIVAFVREDDWDDDQVVAYFDNLRGLLSRRVFDGRAVQIRLCDLFLTPRRMIPVD